MRTSELNDGQSEHFRILSTVWIGQDLKAEMGYKWWPDMGLVAQEAGEQKNACPPFTVKTIRDWLSRLGQKTLFIEPGSPCENWYIESFKGKLWGDLPLISKSEAEKLAAGQASGCVQK